MPYGIKKIGDHWIVFNKDTGRSLGRHQSKTKAVKQLAALHINAKEGEDVTTSEASAPGDEPGLPAPKVRG